MTGDIHRLIEIHEDIVEVHRRLAELEQWPVTPELERELAALLHMLEVLEQRKQDFHRSRPPDRPLRAPG
jgi:hypothetical protein